MIPDVAHFVWLGPDFPWVSSLAIRSALQLGRFSKAVLHHEAVLEGSPVFSELSRLEGLELRRLDVDALLAPIRGETISLLEVYRELDKPAARANVLRAAILLNEGGVYLDADTLTVRDFRPLLSSVGAFVGQEHIALPFTVRSTKNPFVLGLALTRRTARDFFRRLPNGWRGFRKLERLYPAAVNNAVLGASAGHPFLKRLTRAMLELDPSQRSRRFSLGTHLLQRVVAREVEPDMRVLDARYFYPLGPEISEHWFRHYDRPAPVDEVLFPETLVVHWYASVRTAHVVPLIDADYIASHANHQLFSSLVKSTLGTVRK
jgi:hypothetical protein